MEAKLNSDYYRHSFMLVMGPTMFEVRSFKAKNVVFEFEYHKVNMFESV